MEDIQDPRYTAITEALQAMIEDILHEDGPDRAMIEKDPLNARIPTRAYVKLLTMYYLSDKVTVATIAPIMQYVERMEIELQVTFAKALASPMPGNQSRASDVMNSKPFTCWFRKNKKILVAMRGGV
jgi:hypothetical protein